MLWENFKLKSTAAASHGFLAIAQLFLQFRTLGVMLLAQNSQLTTLLQSTVTDVLESMPPITRGDDVL